MRTELLAAVAAATLLATPAAAAAEAGYAGAPFRDHAVELAQAAAIERIEIAARALATGHRTDDAASEAAAGADDALADLDLVRASLVAAAPPLGARFAAAVAGMVRATKAGDDPGQPAQVVIGLAEQARAALVPPGLGEAPGFLAARMASLLLDEGGVAEAYEVAGEGEGYLTGYFALQRVRALWQELSAQAEPARASDVAAMLAMLDDLFPAPEPPERLSPDPEQAEAPAQQLVGLLEGVADADLYPGRDLAAATGLVRQIAETGCGAAATDGNLSRERLAIAATYYTQTVQATLDVLAPDVAAAIAAEFAAPGDQPADGARCGRLLAALDAGRETLAP